MNATQEVWKSIPGWDTNYEVSNLGRVRSLDRIVVRSDGVKTHYKGQLLNPYSSPNNYLRVMLTTDEGSRKWVRVHTLVLEAFVGARPDGYVACHNDGDHFNNCVSNLRWDTYSANNRDLVTHGVHWQSRKTHCKNGHAFTEKNTYRRREGGRKCRRCIRIATDKWSAKKKAAS